MLQVGLIGTPRRFGQRATDRDGPPLPASLPLDRRNCRDKLSKRWRIA
jgi:hypothetical protein